MRTKIGLCAVCAILLCASLTPASAQTTGRALTLRLGIPTDTLVNIEDLYHWGIAAEIGFSAQANAWLVVGGMANFGWSFGKSPLVPEDKLQAGAVLKLGYGRLDGFTVSLLGGAVFFIEKDGIVIPGIGVELGYKRLSLGLSTASLSLGVNLAL